MSILDDVFANRLKFINIQLVESSRWYRLLSNYCRCLNTDMFLINSSLEDECSAIIRTQIDSWLCEIERQQIINSNLATIVVKIQLMNAENCIAESMNPYISRLAEIDASIRDGFLQDKANRPVDGLLPCVIPDEIEKEIQSVEIFCLQPPNSWMDWSERVSKHIFLVNKFAKLFPASHPFASILCSTSILLVRTLKSVQEQDKFEKTLKILTTSNGVNDYSSIFGLDVLLILNRLCPVPTFGDDGE